MISPDGCRTPFRTPYRSNNPPSMLPGPATSFRKDQAPANRDPQSDSLGVTKTKPCIAAVNHRASPSTYLAKNDTGDDTKVSQEPLGFFLRIYPADFGSFLSQICVVSHSLNCACTPLLG